MFTTATHPMSKACAIPAFAPTLVAPVLGVTGALDAMPAAGHEQSADVDQQMTRAVKVGTMLGVPLVFALTAAVGLLGGAGLIASIAIGAWCGLFGGGMYLGTVFLLPKGGDHFERPAEWETPGTLLAKERARISWAGGSTPPA